MPMMAPPAPPGHPEPDDSPSVADLVERSQRLCDDTLTLTQALNTARHQGLRVPGYVTSALALVISSGGSLDIDLQRYRQAHAPADAGPSQALGHELLELARNTPDGRALADQIERQIADRERAA